MPVGDIKRIKRMRPPIDTLDAPLAQSGPTVIYPDPEITCFAKGRSHVNHIIHMSSMTIINRWNKSGNYTTPAIIRCKQTIENPIRRLPTNASKLVKSKTPAFSRTNKGNRQKRRAGQDYNFLETKHSTHNSYPSWKFQADPNELLLASVYSSFRSLTASLTCAFFFWSRELK